MTLPLTRLCLALGLVACGHDAHDVAGDPDAAPACATAPGTFHDQVLALGDGVEDRVYWLHVPPSYDCRATGLLVDFHGTASGKPEEAYQTDALIAMADREGVIVARPRSRSSKVQGADIFRWDENPGDLARNVTYAHALVAHLEQAYAIDPTRVYASGFSSGSNMVAQFLGDPASPFHGLAPIAGGRWGGPPVTADLSVGVPIYMATGYRDYLWPYARSFVAELGDAGLPADKLWLRRGGSGHDLYGWHFDELWAYLDRGERPVGPGLAAPWTAEALPSPADVLALAHDGVRVVAAGAHGRTWIRDAGTWTVDLDRGTSDYTALCFGPGGAVVGGQFGLAHRTDTTWGADGAVPDFFGFFPSSWISTASCRADGSILVGGTWSSALSSDAGAHWAGFPADGTWGGEALINGAATSGATSVMVGYFDYVGRAGPGETQTTVVNHAAQAEWWNAVAAAPGGKFWAVGEAGTIVASTDDGLSWTRQPSGTDLDLYAVSFADDGLRGVAVGRRGVAVLTRDGGATWTALPTGLESFLGAALVVGDSVLIAGEDGVVARAPLLGR